MLQTIAAQIQREKLRKTCRANHSVQSMQHDMYMYVCPHSSHTQTIACSIHIRKHTHARTHAYTHAHTHTSGQLDPTNSRIEDTNSRLYMDPLTLFSFKPAHIHTQRETHGNLLHSSRVGRQVVYMYVRCRAHWGRGTCWRGPVT